ncbi:MAG: hypothetical protein ACFCVF_07845 [Kineosporiaceae bacterium]
MPLWVVLIVIGVILAALGFSGIAEILIWIGIVVLVAGLIGVIVGRRGRT